MNEVTNVTLPREYTGPVVANYETVELGEGESNMSRRMERVRNMDPLMQFAAEIFLNSVIELDTLEKMYDNNINFPLTSTLERPFENYDVKNAIFTNGLPIGEAYTDGFEAYTSMQPDYKQYNVDIKSEFGAVITNNENIFVHDCAQIVGNIDGCNSGIFNMHTRNDTKIKVRERIAGHESWLPVLSSYNECVGAEYDKLPSVVSIAGVFHPMDFVRELDSTSPSFAPRNAKKQFEGQEELFFKNITVDRSMDCPETISLNDLMEMKNNTGICCQTTTKIYNPMTGNFMIRKGCHELGVILPGILNVLSSNIDMGVVANTLNELNSDELRIDDFRYS